MNKNYFKNGTIVAWSNDGEEVTFNSVRDAAQNAYLSEEQMQSLLGTDKEISGCTYFRYGVDTEATEGYDEARAEAEATDEENGD